MKPAKIDLTLSDLALFRQGFDTLYIAEARGVHEATVSRSVYMARCWETEKPMDYQIKKP